MTTQAAKARLRRAASPVDAEAVLSALPQPVFAVDEAGTFRYVNAAAEQFFEASAAALAALRLADFVPPDSPLMALIEQARTGGSSVAGHDIALESPRLRSRTVSVDAAPLGEAPGCVVACLQERSIARKMDLQLNQRGVARSVMAMAAMLAHEIKNPLAGIRGSAQILERDARPEDVELTRLIRDETDRIVALVDRLDMFSDGLAIERGPVNIHEVLEHVRKVAQASFAGHCRISEVYDPSLPPVLGNRDLLVQVFMNLVKNAAEAAPERDGVITLSTRYQHGVRLMLPGTEMRVHLPLVVTVQDNGPGIPEHLKPTLFDPFVTTKPEGKGLGLALVAKIVDDLGGMVSFTSEPRRTVFTVMLPVASDEGRP
ncbi:MAG: PAS domain-containing protein [Rhodospirillaceae bacterium]|nr:PAS domain-containing protein [Rhodospirillaceae bacterium]